MSEPPQPYYWIRRNDGTYVPLIPLDELPSWVGLRGVSSTKDWGNVSWETRFLGDREDRNGRQYVVDIFHDEYPATGQQGDFHSGSSSTTPTKNKNVSTGPVTKGDGSREGEMKPGVDQIQANIDKITLGQGEAPQESQGGSQDETPHYQGTAGTLGKKVYCTYWIRTGNCNYMQEGCKYKHEIPPDDNTRLAIGVRTYPTWPREDPVASAPRPPPVKVLQAQKPALYQPSWRRGGAKGSQVEMSVRQKLANRTNTSHASEVASSSSNSRPGPFSPAHMSGNLNPVVDVSHPAPQIAAVNPAQHFPSHAAFLNQQQSQNNSVPPAFTQGDHHVHQPATMAAGPFTGQSVPHQSAMSESTPGGHQPGTVNSAQHYSNPRQHSLSRHPAAQSTHTNLQTIAPPQSRSNPFTQRVASNSHDHSGAYAPIQHRPAGSSNPSSAKVLNAPSRSESTAPSNNPPPYIPAQPHSTAYTHTRPNVHAAMDSNFPPHAGGPIYDNDNSNTCAGSIDAGMSVTNNQGATSGPRTSSTNAGTFNSRVNTPASSGSNTHGAFNGNAANFHPSGRPSGNRALSFAGIDPSVITARTSTPMSVKGRGPVLYDPYAQSNNAVSDNGSHNNPSEDARSAMSSPPTLHRRMFRAPGEAEFVANPTPQEVQQSRSNRTSRRNVTGSGQGKGKRGGHPGNTRPRTQENSQDPLI